MSENPYPNPDDVPAYAEMSRLDGRNVLVVGAGAGIGRQVCHAVAASGARVGCVDLTADLADGVAREVGGIPIVADVTQEAQIERALAEAAGRLGALHGIVDVVGGARFVGLTGSTVDQWRQAEQLNLEHGLRLAQLAEDVFAAAGGGSLVYVGSAAGTAGSAHNVFYGMAKAALLSLVQTAALELGPGGIRVNAVSPGIVWTPRMQAVIAEDHDRWAALGPLGRMGLPSDVAAVVLFLLSDLAAYITGQNLMLDGGVSVTQPYPVGELRQKVAPKV
jgi:NAD(P)-dependent dehydrogenase (short-subunit alcohol dehydrogenase family)